MEPGGQAKGKSSRMGGELVSSPIEFGASDADSSRLVREFVGLMDRIWVPNVTWLICTWSRM